MEKMQCESQDLTQENIAKLAELFPSVITEGMDENGKPRKAVNFEALRQLLSSEVLAGDEVYEFTWSGKKAAMLEAGRPSRKTLRPCPQDSRNWDTTKNLYIEGDNLDVLKLLRKNYRGLVKIIYIDPPYNTGNDFIYRDSFAVSKQEYQEQGGEITENEAGEKQRLFRNTDANGRFHSDWCSMMYPRLMLARELLNEAGVIFISCDDNEQENLKKLCDELFWRENFVGCLVIETATDNNLRQINTEHEYILCYAKNKNNLGKWYTRNEKAQIIQAEYEKLRDIHKDDIDKIQVNLRKFIKANEKKLAGISHYDNVDEYGVFHDGDIANPKFGGYDYEIIHPVTNKPCRVPEKGFRYAYDTMQEMIRNNQILFGKDETILIKPKIRLEESKDKLRSLIYEDGRSSTGEFESLMARDIFQNPKSSNILERLLKFVLEGDDLAIDFFSGSATFAEAVMRYNLSTGSNASYILVQLPEDLDASFHCSDSKNRQTIKNAIKFLDSIEKPHLLTEIGKERIRRAGDRLRQENRDRESIEKLDIGFRVLKCDSSNMKDVYYEPKDTDQGNLEALISNIKKDRTDLDLLFGCLLEWGLPLSERYVTKEICGYRVHFYAPQADGTAALAACFDPYISEEAVREIACRKPMCAVFRDVGFATSQDRVNAGEMFKTLAPDTGVKII